MIGVVLAGGASSRFGGRPKGLFLLDGRAMALRVADVLAQVCTSVRIEAPVDGGYESLGLPIIHAAAHHAGRGPLAALAAGLSSAFANERVAFAPCDMPLLTPDIYRALAAVDAPGAYASTKAGVEPLVAVLGASMLAEIGKVLKRDELPRTHVALDAAGARAVAFEDMHRFANINSPDDLAKLSEGRGRRG